MDQNDPGLPLDSKLRRRGVLAGVAALGAAALFKITGAAKAEASVLNDPILYGNNHVGTLSTRIASNVADTGAVVFNNFNSVMGVSTGDAIQARTDKANGISAGVRGIGDPNPASGVTAGVVGEYRGTGNSVGVFGHTLGAAASIPLGAQGVGVFGMGTGAHTAVKGESNNGYGVWGASNGAAGVLGTTVAAYAVQGAANGGGIGGVFTSVSGVGARGTSDNFVGLVGVSGTSIGLYGTTAAPGQPALYAENTGGGQAATFIGNVLVLGGFSVIGGPKAAVVPMRDGSQGTMYCQESPEPYFEDFGRAQLTGGAAQVPLDEDFAFLVTRNQYMVFLTPEDNCNGLYVGRRGPSSFEVRELNGGKSNIAFYYRIVAKRRDIQGNRLARHDPNHGKVAANVKTALATPERKIPPNGYGPSFSEPLASARRFAPNGDELPVQLGR